MRRLDLTLRPIKVYAYKKRSHDGATWQLTKKRWNIKNKDQIENYESNSRS